MTDPDRHARLTGAPDPRHRPRRTLAGAFATVALVVVVLAAVAEPLLVAALLATLVGLLGGRRLVIRLARRRGTYRVCLPGTRLCVDC